MTKLRSSFLFFIKAYIILFTTVVLFLMLVESSKGGAAVPVADINGNLHLTDTQMWFIGGVVGFVFAILTVLRKHENDITSLKSRPPKVPADLCHANMTLLKSELDHGAIRFEKIEATLQSSNDKSRERHDEIIRALEKIKG